LLPPALLPQFKLNFLPKDARLSMKRQVLNYVQQEVSFESHTEAHLPTADDNLFSFMNSAGREAAGNPVARQVEEFMESNSTSLLSLKDYSHMLMLPEHS